MRVIITGGSGLIGRALTENLTADHHEVIVLSRNPDWVTGLPKGARAVKWDAKSAQGWGQLIDGAQVIVNLAGESLAGNIPFGTRWTAKRKKAINDSRLNAGKAVVEATQAAKTKPEVLVQASAVGYYGPSDDRRLTEEAPPADDFLANVVIQWENSTKPVEELGVRRVITRTGLVFSGDDRILPWMAFPYRIFVGGPIAGGQQYYAWIHIADEVAAIRFLIDHKEAHGVFNLTAPQQVPQKEFGKAIGRALGRPSWFPLPGFALKLAFGEAATLLIDGQNVAPAHLEQAGFEFKFPEVQPALDDLLRN